MSVFVLLIFLCLVKDIHGQTECSEGSVRLVGGPTADEGRVEYCTGGRWGTICDDMWGLEDAAVVCTQLGFTPFGDERRGVDSSVPSEGAASLPIVLSGLDCVGTESGLAECNHSAPISQCSHSRDAGVRCQCRSEELRFVEGAAANEGRVEYCVGGEWRIICLEGITSEAATVMCRQLGFDPIDGFLSQVLDPFEFNRATIFERTDNAVLLRYPNRLQCSGAESRLANCPMTPFLDIVDDCTSSGVGLRCPTNETGVGAVCNYGEIRLQDGLISAQFGRVEVCFNGQWGVVCGINHFFDGLDAAVACRQLGIEGASVVVGPAPIDLFGFDPTFGRLAVLDDLMCVGNEANLFDCPHPGATIENCQSPFADANVICGISVDRCPDEGISTTVVQQIGEAFPLANFGQCEPYGAQSSFCNEVIPSAGYIYASAAVSLSQVVNQLDVIALSINRDDPECQELVSMVLCNYFFPSCGSENGVHRPTAVCSDVCFYVAETCSETWSQVQSALALSGSLGRVNCSDTTTRLSGLHGCCSSANITIPDPPTTVATTVPSTSPTTAAVPPISKVDALIAPLAGGIIAAIFVIAVILVVIVICLCMNTFRRRKIVREIQMEILTNPSSTITRRASSPQQHSPVKTQSTSPSPSPNHFKARNGSHKGKVVPNPYSNVFPAEKDLDFSAPLLNPDNSKTSHRISSTVIRDLSSDMVIPYARLKLLDCIGQGEFGVVYRAQTTEESGYEVTTVAVKTLKGFFDFAKVDSIMDESLKMKHFEHPNVLGLIGVCLDAGPAPYVVMPFMANGSLLHYLKKERADIVLTAEVDEDVKIDIRKRLTVMCLQIANGMAYLAEEKFVHRDLAARNCMIDLHFVIKISDFGLSEDVYSKNYFRQNDSDNNVKLPVKWMAPESLNDGIFSEKSDVWSYGVTCWEVFSGGRTPYPGVDPLLLTQMLDTNKRLLKPTNSACSIEIYDLMRACWEANPDHRPTFSEIAATISGYMESLAGYMDMQFNPFTASGQEHEQKPTVNGINNDVLTHPEQLAALYDNIPSKNRSSPRVSPLPSPSTGSKGILAPTIQIDSY